MKRIAVLIAGLVLLAGCAAGSNGAPVSGPGETKSQAPAAPADLTGTWKQSNGKSADAWMEATIKGKVIEINWVSDNGDTKSLYWSGTYEAPTAPGNTFEWESKNDHEKTKGAILASSDDTKKFTYADGVLSWETSAMGSTMTIKASRV